MEGSRGPAEGRSARGAASDAGTPRREAEPPAAWLGSDLPPPAFAQAMAADDPDAEFFRGVWAGLAPARTTYDVPHARPWGWKVSGYLWTKSIAAGAFLAAALAPWLGAPDDRTTDIALPLLGLLFLALTTVLLVADLKRPERFLSILWHPNPRSWLARGAFVLVAFGGLGTAWLAAVWLVQPTAVAWLRAPLVAAAVAGAGYSGFLFAQAKGRDFWQSPLLPLHFVVQALVAGLAVAAVLGAASGADGSAGPARLLAAATLLHLGLVVFGEVGVAHPTRDAQRAARTLTRGALRGWYRGALGAGVVAAALGLAVPWLETPGLLAAAGLALAALWIWEHGWLLAGQAVPLS